MNPKQMKNIRTANWIIGGFYTFGGILSYILTMLNPTDKAGQGMALGFAIVFIIYGCIIGGINLINVKWVRIFCLILGLFPIIYYIL